MNVPEERMPALAEIQRDWWVHVLMGLGLIILGILAISLPLVATLAVKTLIGVVFIVGSVFMAVYGLKQHGWSRKLLGLVVAALYLVIGILMLAYPVAAILALTLFLAVFFFVEGAYKIIGSLQHRSLPNWGWGLFSGIVSVILGIIIWSGWPGTSLWAIGLLVGIDLIFAGWWVVMLGLTLHGLPATGGRMIQQH